MATTVILEGECRLITTPKGGGCSWPGHKIRVRSVKGSRVTFEITTPAGVKITTEVDASPETT